MSLKKNILANYLSQIYVTLIGIVMVPMYINYMGTEAYGLVGFFAMLQVWFGLLDMGLTLTLTRETARFRGGALDILAYRSLVRALEVVFICVGIVGGVLLFLNSERIASSWLNIQHLDLATVIFAVQMMAIAIVLRWISGLYRGCISGAEDFRWLGAFNAVMASLRFLGVLPVMIWLGGEPPIFFEYQCLIGLIELSCLFAKAYRLMPALPNNIRLGWSLKSLISSVRPSFQFSMGISFAAFVWVMMTQVDKLLLSKMLSLADYGIFTLTVLVASGVTMISGPLSSALLPRMAKLHAQGHDDKLILLYRKMTRAVVVMVAPASFLLAMFSKKILFAWTGSLLIADQGGSVLSFYALGNGILAVSAFPYYLQYAKGNLRLHLIGSGLFLIVFVSILIFATQTYGVIGAGYAWLTANIAYLLLWTPFIHKRFAKGQHIQWLIHDIAGSSINSVLALFIFSWLMSWADVWPSERITLIFLFIVVGALAITVALLSQVYFRALLKEWLMIKVLHCSKENK